MYISGVYAHGKVSLSDVERYIVKKGGGGNGSGDTSVGGECGDDTGEAAAQWWGVVAQRWGSLAQVVGGFPRRRAIRKTV